jgi:hypothetical protein
MKNTTDEPAVLGPVERQVRPVAGEALELARAFAHAYMDAPRRTDGDARCSAAYEAMKAAILDADKWRARFEWLAAQHWIEPEATFRLGLAETDDADAYMAALVSAVDAKRGPTLPVTGPLRPAAMGPVDWRVGRLVDEGTKG